MAGMDLVQMSSRYGSLRQQWIDPRLRYNSTSERIITIQRDIEDRIWTPDTFFRDSVDVKTHDLPSPNAYARIEPDGSVTLSKRYTVTVLDPTLEYRLKSRGFVNGFKINLSSCEYFTLICKSIQNLEERLTGSWKKKDLTYVWRESHPIQVNPIIVSPLALNPHGKRFVGDGTNDGAPAVLLKSKW